MRLSILSHKERCSEEKELPRQQSGSFVLQKVYRRYSDEYNIALFRDASLKCLLPEEKECCVENNNCFKSSKTIHAKQNTRRTKGLNKLNDKEDKNSLGNCPMIDAIAGNEDSSKQIQKGSENEHAHLDIFSGCRCFVQNTQEVVCSAWKTLDKEKYHVNNMESDSTLFLKAKGDVISKKFYEGNDQKFQGNKSLRQMIFQSKYFENHESDSKRPCQCMRSSGDCIVNSSTAKDETLPNIFQGDENFFMEDGLILLKPHDDSKHPFIKNILKFRI